MASAEVARENGKSEVGVRRIATYVGTLDDLVGAHPDALRKIYGGGRPTDPSELGDAPRGRVLAIEAGREVFFLVRPVIQALGSDAFPWKGKIFDHGGNAGQNVVLGRPVLRFRTELAPSDVDGKPTLSLLYDSPAFKNPWPLRNIKDELRTIAPGIAIGPASITLRGSRKLLLWFGLDHADS
jgi:hypothetical protein